MYTTHSFKKTTFFYLSLYLILRLHQILQIFSRLNLILHIPTKFFFAVFAVTNVCIQANILLFKQDVKSFARIFLCSNSI